MEIAELERKNVNDIKTFYTAITGVSETAETSLGRAVKAAGGFSGALDLLRKNADEAAAQLFTLENVQVAMADAAVQASMAVVAANVGMAFAIDQSVVAFNRATGNTGEYSDELVNLSTELLNVGVGVNDATAAFQSFFTQVRGFTELTATQRSEIAQSAAMLEKMGFGLDMQAKNVLFLNKSMGLSMNEAQGFNTALAGLATQLGMPIDELTSGFEAARQVLGASANSSAELEDQFASLAVQAKATNIPIAELVAITRQFDTFEGAAQSVGRLNAVLGGPFLSTLEMVGETDPAARFEMLADALDQTGRSFQDMGYYEKQAIASAAGLKDVNQLALVMARNFDSIVPPELTPQDIEEQAAQMSNFNTITEKMQNSFMNLIIAAEPLVNVMVGFADGLSQVMNYLGESPAAMGALAGAMTVLGGAIAFSFLPPLVASLTAMAGLIGLGGPLAMAGVVGGLALTGAAVGALMASTEPEPVEDALIPASNDNRPVVKTAKGTFIGREDDAVMFGTRLTELSAPASAQTSSASSQVIDFQPTVKVAFSIGDRELATTIGEILEIDEGTKLGNSVTRLITRGDMG